MIRMIAWTAMLAAALGSAAEKLPKPDRIPAAPTPQQAALIR